MGYHRARSDSGIAVVAGNSTGNGQCGTKSLHGADDLVGSFGIGTRKECRAQDEHSQDASEVEGLAGEMNTVDKIIHTLRDAGLVLVGFVAGALSELLCQK